jgi:hypothetical protein
MQDQILPGKGEWEVLVAERTDTPATALVDLLRQPSKPADPHEICAADLELVPYFALVDGSGTVIQPAMPTDGCGKPQAAAVAALNALPFRALSTTPSAPIEVPLTH